ncbi:MAG: SCO family protein [Tepidisphaeraceae bacterium]
MVRRSIQLLTACLASTLLVSAPAVAQYHQQAVGAIDKPLPLPYSEGEVGVDQAKVGEQIPLDLPFVDEDGKPVKIGDYFNKGRPVLLNIGYYQCPMLCGVMNQKMVAALKGVPFDIGTEFDVVNVSINPTETWEVAKKKKETYVAALGKPGNAVGWHLLTGDAVSIEALTRVVGYKYKKVDKEYAHPAVFILVGDNGQVTHYLDALVVDSETMRLALVESSGKKIGSFWDKAFVTCFDRDPHTGKYTKIATGVMQIGSLVFVLGFAAIMVPLWWKSLKRSNERTNGKDAAPPAGTVKPA